MLALQAQDWPGARWSVGVRTAVATEAEVIAACNAGEIVRSWPLRGTLHLVAAEDLGWLLELTSARALASAAPRRATLGLTEADVERARDAAVGALPGRTSLSRPELLAAIEAGGVATGGQRGYHLLWYLAQTGTLVLGPTSGGQQTFARLDAWVTAPRRLDRDEALAELAVRYLRSHGPARVEDIVRWAGLTVRDVRRGLAVGGEALAALEVEGETYLVAADAPDQAPEHGVAHLLPGFDEYLLGYRDRTAMLAPEYSNAIVPGGNGMFRPTLVADGEVVGTWTRRTGAREVALELAPFGPLDAATRSGLEAAAARYGRFLGLAVRLRVDPARQ